MLSMNKASSGVFYLFALLMLVPAVDSKLKYVQILFRHGDRTPTHTYPNDPHPADTWTQGWGQLTQIGMQQEGMLGKFLKHRYIDTGFLPAAYHADDIYIVSTYKDRAIMSAYCMLAGLYPPTGDQVWDAALPWQPIPVHTIPKELDTFLELKCATYDKLLDEFSHTDYAKQLVMQYADLINVTGRYSGYPATWESLKDMIDPIYVEFNHNMTYPDWLMKDDLYKKFLGLKDLKAQLKFPTKALAKIRGGPLLGKILKNFEDVAYFNNITEKIDFYSGHDTNINALLSVMGMFNGLHMNYATAVLMELHHTTDQGWTVQFYYRNDSSVPPYQLTVPGCNFSCPLSQLRHLVHDGIPEDEYESCYGHKQVQQCAPSAATTTRATPVVTAPASGLNQRDDLECSDGRMRIHVPNSLLPNFSVTLRDPSCKVASNGSHFVTDVALDDCGTTVTFTNDSVIFTNELMATAPSGTTPKSIIDYGLGSGDQLVPVSCVFPRDSRLDFNYIPLKRQAHFYEKHFGHLSFEVNQYEDEQFSKMMAHTGQPVGVTLNTEVFIDVGVHHDSNNGVGIRVDSCIATPTASPADPVWYPLIKDGCPAQQDVRTFTAPDNSNFRFSFLVFKFTQTPQQNSGSNMPPHPVVYLHCQVSACPQNNCSSSCNSGSSRVKREADVTSSARLSAGPFLFKSEDEGTGYSSGVVAATVSMAALTTLVAMVALVAWRRSVNKLKKYQSCDESS